MEEDLEKDLKNLMYTIEMHHISSEPIQNLIARYKELEKEDTKIRAKFILQLDDYIPKSKIKEKIEEYNTQREKTHKHDEYHMFVNYIDVLQELLEEE